MRATEIQLSDRSTVIVPNSQLISQNVRNVTMGNSTQGVATLMLTFPLNTDPEQVRDLLLDAYRDAVAASTGATITITDDIDEAVHARRLDGGETGLIGVAEYMFTVRPDGTFTDPVLRASSGSPELDASARRAVLAASGKVRRPAIIGTEPIPVILHVKYQYGLR